MAKEKRVRRKAKRGGRSKNWHCLTPEQRKLSLALSRPIVRRDASGREF